jgi:hypothetical protein
MGSLDSGISRLPSIEEEPSAPMMPVKMRDSETYSIKDQSKRGHSEPCPVGVIETADNGAKYVDDPDQTVDWNADDEDFQRPAKLELIVGFLRFFCFLSVCTSVFAVLISILFPIQQTQTVISLIIETFTFNEEGMNDTFNYVAQKKKPNLMYDERDLLFYLRLTAGTVQLAYLFVNAGFVIIDSIGTVTFRWKEYGELTHRHTDATSIMFLVSKSRWKQRFLSALTVASATSLQTTHVILAFYGRGPEGTVHEKTPVKAVHAVVWYLSLMLVGLVAVLLGFMLSLIPANWGNVPWLDNRQTDQHIDDKDDKWKSFRELAIHERKPRMTDQDGPMSFMRRTTTAWKNLPKSLKKRPKSLKERFVPKTYKELTWFGFILETLKRCIYCMSYVFSITMDLYTLMLMLSNPPADTFEVFTCLMSTICTNLISLYLVTLVLLQCSQLPHQSTPFLSKVYVPFTLSCGLRSLLDLNHDKAQQHFFGYVYISLLSAYIFLHILGFITEKWVTKEPIHNFVFKFFRFNFYTAEGSYKKWVRLFDTLGGFFGLIGLILGLFSLFCDQYDLEFELQGELKEVMDSFKNFYKHIKDVADVLKEIIDELAKYNVTCKNLYDALIGGTAAVIISSLIPGRSCNVLYIETPTMFRIKRMDEHCRQRGLLCYKGFTSSHQPCKHPAKKPEDHFQYRPGHCQNNKILCQQHQEFHHWRIFRDLDPPSPPSPSCRCRYLCLLLILLAPAHPFLLGSSAPGLHV